MIKPTLGRILWLNPHPSAGITEQQAALIAHVNEDGTLNLTVSAPDGTSYAMQNVELVQEGEPIPNAAYAQWMPYQLGQAAKTEAVLAGKGPSTSEASASNGTSASDSTNTTENNGAIVQGATDPAAHETLIEHVEHAAETVIDEVKTIL